jgi:Domain of unknown function (DUF4159)
MESSVPRVQLKRVNPFMGLMIDAKTWLDAHDYHRHASQAHTLAMHGWGIVAGLEVEAAEPPDRSVWIRPGVAVDPEGRIIIVAQPFRYHITTDEAGLIYLVLMFREIPVEPLPSIEDGTERPSRLLEAYAIYERDRLPDQPHVELARVLLSDGKSPLRKAADPTAPGPNEIDTRYREQAGIRPGPRVTVGVWKPEEAAGAPAHHLAGPTRLLSALGSGLEWRLRRRDQPQGAEGMVDCDLLIMPLTAKTTPNNSELKWLTAFLDDGGVLLIEACAVGEGKGKGDHDGGQSLLAIVAKGVGREPHSLERDHPLLTARHVFATPPPGAALGELLEHDGLLVSTADYACAWNGGTLDKPLERATIRAAVEFAENMLAYAMARRGMARRATRNEKKG